VSGANDVGLARVDDDSYLQRQPREEPENDAEHSGDGLSVAKLVGNYDPGRR
jgi:hypothetical protein